MSPLQLASALISSDGYVLIYWIICSFRVDSTAIGGYHFHAR